MKDLVAKRRKVLECDNITKEKRMKRLSKLLDSVTAETFIKSTAIIEHSLVANGEYILPQMSMQLLTDDELFINIAELVKEDIKLVDVIKTKLYLGSASSDEFDVRYNRTVERIAPSHDFIMSEVKYYFSKYDVDLKFNRTIFEGNEYILTIIGA